MTALATTLRTLDAPRPTPGISDPRRSALVLLRGDGAPRFDEAPSSDSVSAPAGVPAGGEILSRDAIATALMDLFRRTRSREAFDSLVELTKDQLLARVNSRIRFVDQSVDPQELLQDAFINIYYYPDRFDARRPGAFRAWSTTIVDNSVRRYMRKAKSGPHVRLQPIEILAQEADEPERGPIRQAILTEQYREVARAFQLFLALYLRAFQVLSERPHAPSYGVPTRQPANVSTITETPGIGTRVLAPLRPPESVSRLR